MPAERLGWVFARSEAIPPSSLGCSRRIVWLSQGLPASIVSGSSLTPGVSSRAKARSGGSTSLNLASDGSACSSVGASSASVACSELDSAASAPAVIEKFVISELSSSSRELELREHDPGVVDQLR